MTAAERARAYATSAHGAPLHVAVVLAVDRDVELAIHPAQRVRLRRGGHPGVAHPALDLGEGQGVQRGDKARTQFDTLQPCFQPPVVREGELVATSNPREATAGEEALQPVGSLRSQGAGSGRRSGERGLLGVGCPRCTLDEAGGQGGDGERGKHEEGGGVHGWFQSCAPSTTGTDAFLAE